MEVGIHRAVDNNNINNNNNINSKTKQNGSIKI